MGVKFTEYLTPEERAERTMGKLGLEVAKTPKPKPSVKERFKIGMGRYKEGAQRVETVLGKGAKTARSVSKGVGKARRSVRRDLKEFRREQKAMGFGGFDGGVMGLPRTKQKKRQKPQKYHVRGGVAYPISKGKSKPKKKKSKKRESLLGDMSGIF